MFDPAVFAGAVVLASAFPLAHWSGGLTTRYRSRWKAVSAGVAISYMFLGVLPELAEHQPAVAELSHGSILNAEKHIYAWALAGFLVFAALSEIRFEKRGEESLSRSALLFFWGRISGFALYVLLIGYLLEYREDPSQLSLWIYVGAMGLHLFMLDILIAEQFESLYEPGGRLVMMAVVFAGWALGALHAFPDSFTSRLFAFLLGGVTITSAHEEFTVGKASHFWWFVGGAIAYEVLLLLV